MALYEISITSAYIPLDLRTAVSSSSDISIPNPFPQNVGLFGDATQTVDKFRVVINAGTDRRAGEILQLGGTGIYQGIEYYTEFDPTFSETFYCARGDSIHRLDIVAIGATKTHDPALIQSLVYQNQGRIATASPATLSETTECMRTFGWPIGDRRSVSLSMVAQ